MACGVGGRLDVVLIANGDAAVGDAASAVGLASMYE
jgi:hypothetical protein